MLRAGAVLAQTAAQAGRGIAGWRDRAGDDPLAFLEASNRRPELLDDADRFMADRQASANRIFALQDMHVSAADARFMNFDEHIVDACLRLRHVLEPEAGF